MDGNSWNYQDSRHDILSLTSCPRIVGILQFFKVRVFFFSSIGRILWYLDHMLDTLSHQNRKMVPEILDNEMNGLAVKIATLTSTLKYFFSSQELKSGH